MRSLKGHKLIWLAVTRGQCECGEDHFLDPDEMEGCNDSECQDKILDKHAEHIEYERAMS